VNDSRHILLLGASGFLGRHLALHLPALFPDHAIWKPTSEECNLREWTQPEYFVQHAIGEAPFMVINAAYSRDVNYHALIELNVVESWRATFSDSIMITIGTDAAYDPALQHDEVRYFTGAPYHQWYGHGLIKRLIAKICMDEGDESMWYHFVATSLFGSMHSMDDTHIIPDMMRKAIVAKENGTDWEVPGQGIRECVYVPDFVSNMMAIAGNAPPGIWNLGSTKKQMLVGAIAEEVAKTVMLDKKHIKRTNLDNPYNKLLVNTKAEQFLGLSHFKDTGWTKSLEAVYNYQKYSGGSTHQLPQVPF